MTSTPAYKILINRLRRRVHRVFSTSDVGNKKDIHFVWRFSHPKLGSFRGSA